MKLKISFPGGLWPLGKDIKHNTFIGDDDSDDKDLPQLPHPNGGLYVAGILIFLMALMVIATKCEAQPKTDGGLKIGDKVPDMEVSHVLNHPTGTIKLSDFKGKLLIIDFWATWCSPCVAMIPKMDSLQKKFDGKVQFFPVTYQPAAEVEAFMIKLQKQQHRTFSLPEATGDKQLARLFPHTYLPHYVWIDGTGVIKAITEFTEVTSANIQKMLTQAIGLSEKMDEKPVSYIRDAPLFFSNNGGTGNNLLYHSFISSYTAGIGSGYQIKTDSINGRKITCRNQTISRLFKVAYSVPGKVFNQFNTEFRVRDTTKLTSPKSGQEYVNWMKEGNGFCYELQLPAKLIANAFTIMQQDLSRYFIQYKAFIEKKHKPCMVLVRTDSAVVLPLSLTKQAVVIDRFGIKANHVTPDLLISRMNFLLKSGTVFIDETGISRPVDIEISAKTSDMAQMNAQLSRYGLMFKSELREIETLVIKDNN